MFDGALHAGGLNAVVHSGRTILGIHMFHSQGDVGQTFARPWEAVTDHLVDDAFFRSLPPLDLYRWGTCNTEECGSEIVCPTSFSTDLRASRSVAWPRKVVGQAVASGR